MSKVANKMDGIKLKGVDDIDKLSPLSRTF